MTKPGDLPISKGTCITAEMKKDRIGHNNPPEKMTIFDEERKKFKDWKDMYEKEHKLKQEAEGELSIMKGIETNRVKEAQARSSQLQDEMDRVKRENNDLHNKIADLTEVAQSKDYFHDPDYKYLIEENQRLEQEKNELLIVNKKLNQAAEDRISNMRKSGM